MRTADMRRLLGSVEVPQLVGLVARDLAEQGCGECSLDITLMDWCKGCLLLLHSATEQELRRAARAADVGLDHALGRAPSSPWAGPVSCAHCEGPVLLEGMPCRTCEAPLCRACKIRELAVREPVDGCPLGPPAEVKSGERKHECAHCARPKVRRGPGRKPRCCDCDGRLCPRCAGLRDEHPCPNDVAAEASR